MELTREAMAQEALERMKLLMLHQNPIKEFKEEGKLNLSEQTGALFWLDDRQNELVRAWEENTGNLVYHVIHCYTEFGELLNLLFISEYQEEWPLDREDIQTGRALCYTINLDDDYCSEMGTIGIKPLFGGVIRTW